MKISWNLILRPDLQEKLNIRLREVQKPLLWYFIWVIPILSILMLIRHFKEKRY